MSKGRVAPFVWEESSGASVHRVVGGTLAVTKDGEFGSETTLSFVFRLSSLVPRLSAVCWVAGCCSWFAVCSAAGLSTWDPARERAAAGYVELGEILRRHPRPCNSKNVAPSTQHDRGGFAFRCLSCRLSMAGRNDSGGNDRDGADAVALVSGCVCSLCLLISHLPPAAEVKAWFRETQRQQTAALACFRVLSATTSHPTRI